jgi:Fe(II)/alpha-ketoglutarate-dependent arginine beta-hydroxylase
VKNSLFLNEYDSNIINNLINANLNLVNIEKFDKEAILNNLTFLSCELPPKIIKFVKNFQISVTDKDRICLISNLMIEDCGKTPSKIFLDNFINKSSYGSFKAEILICLISSLLGQIFGWKAEQNSRLIHDIFPIKEHENSQESTGSYQLIHWHTEEAFHPFSSDYLCLLCLKNEQEVPTTYCSINSLDLSGSEYDILFEPRFIFNKVSSHKALDKKENPYINSVLYGDRNKPFIRIDYYFMDVIDGDVNASSALNKLINLINSSLKKLVLKPGDLLLIDNALCVHGRDSFIPKYDGNDRWLKRVNITRDIYKSRNKDNPINSRLLL